MTRDLAPLARAFLDVTGLTLDASVVEAGLSAVFAEQTRLAKARTLANEILHRRVAALTARFEAEHGVRIADVLARPPRKPNPELDAYEWTLRQHRLTGSEIAAVTGRARRNVIEGIRRHELRMDAGVRVAARRAAHG